MIYYINYIYYIWVIKDNCQYRLIANLPLNIHMLYYIYAVQYIVWGLSSHHCCKCYHNELIHNWQSHYSDVKMGTIASQITSLTIVYSADYSDADQRKHQSSSSLAFVWGIHRGPVNSPHKWPVTRKMFPFDDVIVRTLDTRFIVHVTGCDSVVQWNLSITTT